MKTYVNSGGLNGLPDTTISSAAEAQMLRYSGSAWVNSYATLKYDNTKGAANWSAELGRHYSVSTASASGNVTMTLPAASVAGAEIRVKLMNATHSVVVAVASGEKLDVTTNGTYTLSTVAQSLTFVDNGSDGWEIV